MAKRDVKVKKYFVVKYCWFVN